MGKLSTLIKLKFYWEKVNDGMSLVHYERAKLLDYITNHDVNVCDLITQSKVVDIELKNISVLLKDLEKIFLSLI